MNAMDFTQRENDRKKREERRTEKGNQLERGGSWSIMVSHSRSAEKRKVERQSDEENKRGKNNRRSFREKLQQRGKKR